MERALLAPRIGFTGSGTSGGLEDRARALGGSLMFRCARCNKVGAPREAPVFVATERRERTYPLEPDEQGNARTGVGWEIVCEEMRCKKCVAAEVVDV